MLLGEPAPAPAQARRHALPPDRAPNRLRPRAPTHRTSITVPSCEHTMKARPSANLRALMISTAQDGVGLGRRAMDRATRARPLAHHEMSTGAPSKKSASRSAGHLGTSWFSLARSVGLRGGAYHRRRAWGEKGQRRHARVQRRLPHANIVLHARCAVGADANGSDSEPRAHTQRQTCPPARAPTAQSANGGSDGSSRCSVGAKRCGATACQANPPRRSPAQCGHRPPRWWAACGP